jgi:hypothetical protein
MMTTRFPRTTGRSRRGFTILEVLVASSIAFILIAAATEMALAMGRSVRKVEAQADLGVRTAIAHGFLQRELAAAAFQWRVSQDVGGVNTGSFGAGNCAPASNVCSLVNGHFYPVRICRSSTVNSTQCDAPASTEADALVTYAPRDPIVEALVIRTKSDGLPFPTDCSLPTNPVLVRATGMNTVPWADGDLVLVAKANHVSVGVLRTALPANTDPAQLRSVSIELGPTSATGGLANDDGGRSGCSLRDSLLSASVFRIKQVIVKLDEQIGSASRRNLLLGTRSTANGPLTWNPIVPDVDDLQFQFDIAKVDAQTKAGSFCTSDTSDLWTGGSIASCGGPLARTADVAAGRNLVRLLGLRAGIVLRSRVESDFVTRPIPLLFDRTGPTGSDRRMRRVVNMFLGLPNGMQ